MKRKLLIIPLLFALAFLPVAQAMSQAAAPAESQHHGMLDGMLMDCGQVEHGDCIDIDCCTSGSHASCDANAKATPVSRQLSFRPGGDVFDADPPGRYLSLPAGRLLRPPRNA